MKAIEIIEQLRAQMIEMGYSQSAIRTEVQTRYGHWADLVVYEYERAKIIFEVKLGLHLPQDLETSGIGFHPAVRQAQSLAQELQAPYFAVANGYVISWFRSDEATGRPILLEAPILPKVYEQNITKDNKNLVSEILWRLSDLIEGCA